MKKYEIRFHML